jgi:hypothetical protein
MISSRFIAAVCLAFVASACSSDKEESKPSGAGADGGAVPEGGATGTKVPKSTTDATFKAGGSIGQVWVTDAKEGDVLILVDADSNEVARGTADRLGSFIFRPVKAGAGYTVRVVKGSTVAGTPPLKVLTRTDAVDPSVYKQELKAGLNYVKVRDGIELAITVRPPVDSTTLKPLALTDGPFPTVIEYSGYDVAAPHDLLAAAVGAVSSGKTLASLADPLLPGTSTAVGALILPMLGFVGVSVQMRGSGCSGGDFQLFDIPSSYDGYDAIEIVAAQSWAKGHKVGMGGISFSGISQLSVAGTQPPSLAAISPMSVTDDIYTAVGFPGGIFNNGFAASWLHERQDNALPATDADAAGKVQPYATELIKQGDTHCADNQKLRLQTLDIDKVLNANPFRDPALVDDRSAITWADKIKVPVFLVGQFHDEQTGGHFTEMLSKFAANKDVWFSLQNGVHCDSLGPATIERWGEFLNLFVADAIPKIPAAVTGLGPTLYAQIASGSAAMAIPATRFDAFKDPALARDEFRKDPRVRLLLDSGSGQAGVGALEPTWELGFDAWPVKTAAATAYYLSDGGALTTTAPAASGEVSYTGDPAKRSSATLGGTGTGDAWAPDPKYIWDPVTTAGVGFTTAALTKTVVIAGTSSLDLELQSSAKDTDLQVTLSDVRPDGKEMYVQNGWIRASHRKVDDTLSTPTDPVQLHKKEDAKDLPAGTFETVRVQIYSVGYAFRAGHKIRVTVQAPGGDRPRWKFDTIEKGTTKNTIQLGKSKLVLPVVDPGTTTIPSMPACPSNRGQPCRAYTTASNGG